MKFKLYYYSLLFIDIILSDIYEMMLQFGTKN